MPEKGKVSQQMSSSPFCCPWLESASSWFFIALFILFGASATKLNQEIRGTGASWVEPPRQATEKWNPTLFKALTMGHWPLAVDWLWIRSLQDPALMHVQPGEHASFFYDLDLAADLDPPFSDIYIHGATLLSIIRNDNEGALVILKKGNRFRTEELSKFQGKFVQDYWYRSWWLPLTMGYIYMYEIQDIAAAGVAFKEAAEVKGAPYYLASLQRRLQTIPGQYEVGLRLIENWESTSKDEKTKEAFSLKKKSLLLSQYLYQLNEEFRSYLKKFPQYRNQLTIPQATMNRYWIKFQKEKRVPQTDPWGGELSLDSSGKIDSTTPREKVFGLK